MTQTETVETLAGRIAEQYQRDGDEELRGRALPLRVCELTDGDIYFVPQVSLPAYRPQIRRMLTWELDADDLTQLSEAAQYGELVDLLDSWFECEGSA